MNKKDTILNLSLKIKIMLDEVMEEEYGCNEGSLSMHYKEINEILDYIIRERLLEIVKRYNENGKN